MSAILRAFCLQLWQLAVLLMFFLAMGFISLVDKIQFMLINRRHICIKSIIVNSLEIKMISIRLNGELFLSFWMWNNNWEYLITTNTISPPLRWKIWFNKYSLLKYSLTRHSTLLPVPLISCTVSWYYFAFGVLFAGVVRTTPIAFDVFSAISARRTIFARLICGWRSTGCCVCVCWRYRRGGRFDTMYTAKKDHHQNQLHVCGVFNSGRRLSFKIVAFCCAMKVTS